MVRFPSGAQKHFSEFAINLEQRTVYFQITKLQGISYKPMQMFPLSIACIFFFFVQAEEQNEIFRRKNKEDEEAYKVKKRTADLLPDASNNITKLEVRNGYMACVTDASGRKKNKK